VCAVTAVGAETEGGAVVLVVVVDSWCCGLVAGWVVAVVAAADFP
jgi:hypothetical protein